MSIYNAYIALSGVIDGEVMRSERLSRHTSNRIGGPASLYVSCNTYASLTRCIETLNDQNVGWVILGRGSNVLVSDEGYGGCVICLRGEFSRSRFDDTTVIAGAGMMLSQLVNETLSRGLSGMEPFVGIPGTLGGALVINAGSRRETIGSIVRDCVVYCPGVGLRRYQAADISWGYRQTSLARDNIILEATLDLIPSTKESVSANMERRLIRRRSSQPLGSPTSGAVFHNPGGGLAVGQMIEACKLKGYSVGQASISERNANFIINRGGASAQDVLSIIRHVRDTVREVYGVELETDIKFLGFAS